MKLHKLMSASTAPARAASASPWPKQLSGFVVSSNRPPMPPVASTTRAVLSFTKQDGVAAITPTIALSSTTRRHASNGASTLIDGVRCAA